MHECRLIEVGHIGHAVDDDKRVVFAGKASNSTHREQGTFACHTRLLRQLKTGELALQCLIDSYCAYTEILLGNILNARSVIEAFLCSEDAFDERLVVMKFRLRHKVDGKFLLVVDNSYRFGIEARSLDAQLQPLLGLLDLEVAILIASYQAMTWHGDDGIADWTIMVVEHDTLDAVGRLLCTDARRKHQEKHTHQMFELCYMTHFNSYLRLDEGTSG